MKGYTIQHSIDLLEKAVESSGGGSGGGTAASVSYSNTSSGLVATNVQSAIDEIDASVDTLATDVNTLKGGHVYSTNERVVGVWLDNRPVYEKVIELGGLPNVSTKNVAHGIDDLDFIISLSAMAHNSTSGNSIQLSAVNTDQATAQVVLYANDTNLIITTGADRSAYDSAYAIVQYVKTPTNNTRSKKSK